MLDTGEDAFDAGSEAVYGQWLLWRTREALPRSIRLPEEISPLVQQVYGWEREAPGGAQGEEMRCIYEQTQEKKKARAEAYLVPQPETHRLAQLNTLDDWSLIKSSMIELFEGKYATGADYCAYLDTLCD